MNEKPQPTTHATVVQVAEVYCAQRLLAGVPREQTKRELLAVYYQVLDAEFSRSPLLPRQDAWPYPPEAVAMDGLAGDFVSMVEPHSEADPAALLGQFYVAFGNAAGRHAFVRVEDDRHFPNLFALVVGETARGRKGTSWRRIEAVFRLADEKWAADCILPGGLSSGEGLTWAVRDPNESTGDCGILDKRLLVAEGEFPAVMKVLEREGNTLSPILRSAWDTGSLSIRNKNSPCRATGAHVSIAAHVTRDEFLARLDGAELAGGTMNRFLHIASRRSKLLPGGGRVPHEEMQQFAGRLRESLAFARIDREVKLSPGARALWHTVYPHLTADRAGQYGSATARAEAQALRVALVAALMDCSDTIEERHLWQALAIWDYCDRSAAFVYGLRQVDRTQDSVLSIIRGHGGWISREEIVNAKSRHLHGARLQEALDALIRALLIERREEPTEGRPRELFRAIHARKASVMELCSLPSQESEGGRSTEGNDASSSAGGKSELDPRADEERRAIQEEPAS